MVRTAAENARAAFHRLGHGPHEFLRAWDKGGKSLRFALLARFTELCDGMTEAELEKFFGMGASLVLTRFTAWLRVIFGTGERDSISSQLMKAIGVFVAPTASTRFVVEFVEQGGALTALEFLTLDEGHEQSKTAALEVLLLVAKAGPKFKTVLQKCDATKYVAKYIEGDGKEKDLAVDVLEAVREA
mmetsp:Transcript_30848/g.80724  ORF Transcript_30848/g.80724 Transcript_30848/m.80724 type:complete len:187 (+) Transcript_30848:93-653(+)